MTQKSIFPAGIIRNTPDEATVDGAMLEMINLRNKDGAIRGVRYKEENTSSLINIGSRSRIYHHPNSDLYICSVLRNATYNIELWQASASGGIIQYFAANPSNVNPYSQISVGTTDDLIVTHVGNFVFCSSVSAKNSWILYWDAESNTFVQLERLVPIKFAAGTYNNTPIECVKDVSALTEDSEKYDAIIGEFTKIIAEQRKNGLFNGHVCLRYAYKLFDGSTVMHSDMFYVKGGFVYRDVTIGDINGLQVNYSGSQASIYNDDTAGTERLVLDQIRLYVDATSVLPILQQWDNLKLIRSVCVYITLIEEGYSVPETTSGLITHSGIQFFPYKEDLSAVFDPQSMFMIKEWTVSELTNEFTYDIPDLTGIELNEALAIDNYTHHQYLPTCEFTLNNRLHLGNVVANPGNPLKNEFRLYFSATNTNIVPDADIADLICNEVVTHSAIPSTFKVYLTISLLTDNGVKKKTIEVTDNVYEKTYVVGGITLTSYSLMLNPVIIYPDSRARKIVVTVKNTTGYIQDLHTIDLKPSTWSNYSYHASSTSQFYNYCDFILTNHELFIRAASVNNSSIDYSDTIIDKNRVQVSMLNNPFVFPAENSYRFGAENNTVIGMITAQEPITETVFGQYPLNVFTDNGIYALEQGSGSILYSNVVELNKEVLSNPKGLYGISGAILFITKEGLKVLQGRQVDNISIPVKGSVTNPVSNEAHYSEAMLDSKVCILLPLLSPDFIAFIQNASIGFSSVFQEIYLSNNDYTMTYVFSLESKSWHTITHRFSQFLLNQGFVDGKLLNLDSEAGSTTEYLLQTRPFFLQDAGHKKIEQLLIRSSRTIALNKYDIALLYGSNDGKNFSVIAKVYSSNETKTLLKNVPGHYRYFILAYAGQGTSLELISIDINFNSRYTNKIR